MTSWPAILSAFFGESSWQVLALAFVFGLFAVLRNLSEFAWKQKERKVSHIKTALEIENLSDEVRFVLVEDMNRTLFMNVTGIPGDRYTRQIYAELLEKSEGDLTINQLRRASNFLEFDKCIQVPKGRSRKIGYCVDKWYPLLVLFVCAIQTITMIVFYDPKLLWVQLSLVIGSLVLASFLYRRSVNYEIALDIEKQSKIENDGLVISASSKIPGKYKDKVLP
ncbi:hypothetical protein [uncultured Neptuniibacter sp.]|uniref:hypothetical protein n=1 Tax=uncultured Neptuniibacter sp. TaxID=502143 RepID=UPI0026251843|nr:hypothetical protein [uncultured Neptuniibacter sp.]